MKQIKKTKITIRLSEFEKQKVKDEASKLNLDTSKFIRQYFIQLISAK
jgi:predicted DNA binding CopG/RHH family protein